MSEEQDRIDRAVAQMKRALSEADRDPRVARLAANLDQMGAQLRDMGREEWEAAVQSMLETTEMTEVQVRNWFGRLSGKCAGDDAEWTGMET